MSNANGVLVGWPLSEPGTHNDKGAFNRDEADCGLVSRVMAGKSKSKSKTMTIWGYIDRGFGGLAKNTPARTSGCRRSSRRAAGWRRRKRPKTGRSQGAHPDRAQQRPAKAYAASGRCPAHGVDLRAQQRPAKAYAALRGRHHGKSGRLARSLNVITRLVNLHLLIGSPDQDNTHRKGKKPCSKTYCNICQ